MEQASEHFSKRSEDDQRAAERRDFIRLVSYTIQTQRFAADVCGKLFSLSKQVTDDAKRLTPSNVVDSERNSQSLHSLGVPSRPLIATGDMQEKIIALSRQMDELMTFLHGNDAKNG